MPAKVFVDSNIWLYSLIQKRDDHRHQQAAVFVLCLSHPVINSQVIREICNNLIKRAGLPEEQLRVLIYRWYQDCEVAPSKCLRTLACFPAEGVLFVELLG